MVLRNRSDTAVNRNTFWIVFWGYWLGTAPGAPFYVNAWERITEWGEQGKRGKKANMRKQWDDTEICWVGMAVWQGNVHTLSPPTPILVVFINDEDFHSLSLFFIFFPGKDEVLMRWISVLPLKSSVIQLKGVNHLSRQDVFPLFSLSYIITCQMSFPLSCSFWDPADITVGWQRHSWAQLGIPSRGATMNMCP